MSDKKVTPTRQARGWETLTGQATPTREATTWEKLTGQATPTREASWWEKATGQATPTREATTWERISGQATPTRQASWWETIAGGGGGGSFGAGYSLGEKLGKLAVIVLALVLVIPGFILDKLFPDKRGTSRVWLYSLLFWPLVGGTIYMERRLGTSVAFFGIQLVLLSLVNIVLGLVVSQSLFKPRLPLRAKTIFDRSEPLLPWIGWLGFVPGLFCLTWTLAAHWPFPALLPPMTAIISGSILVRPILARIEPVTWFVGLACIAAAVFHLIFGWNVNLAAAPVTAREGAPATRQGGTDAANGRDAGRKSTTGSRIATTGGGSQGTVSVGEDAPRPTRQGGTAATNGRGTRGRRDVPMMPDEEPRTFCTTVIVSGLGFAGEQSKTINQLQAQHWLQFYATNAKLDGIYTDEQNKASRDAMLAARNAGKTDSEVLEAGRDAVKLTEEQQAERKALLADIVDGNRRLEAEVMAALTDDQRAKLQERRERLKPYVDYGRYFR